MKLTTTFISLFATAALVLMGCTEKDNPQGNDTPQDDVLSIAPEYLAFAAEGGENTITVTATSQWSYDNNADWLTVTPANDGKTFKVTAAENGNTTTREAIIYVNTSTKSVYVSVSQEAAEAEKKCWGVVREADDWTDDIKMTEAFPGIWISPKVNFEGKAWIIRFDGNWSNGNVGCGKISQTGEMGQAIFGGDNMKIAESEGVVVYNENNGTIGTLAWGLLTKDIKSLSSVSGYDYPMSKGSDGKWYSLPVELSIGDVITAHNGDNSIKLAQVSEAGTYIVEFDAGESTCNLNRNVWSVYGDFNNWSSNEYMFYAGGNSWYLFNRHYEGGWKVRKCGNPTKDYGGNYVWRDPFEVTEGGNSIIVSEPGLPAAGYNVIFDSAEETVLINQDII